MKVVRNVLTVVGRTPMIKLEFPGVEADVFAKMEYLNPSGSIKDRIAKYMIEQAEKCGDLEAGYTIVEATSGNTGIAFSFSAAAKGYRMVVVMPEVVSEERTRIAKAYGADVVLTSAAGFIEGSVEKAKELARQPGFWMPSQFSNFDNVGAHRETTGKEILEQTSGKVDAFVAGIGTGGTLMGVAEALRAQNPDVKIFGVEPAESPVIAKGGPVGTHRIEGIGDGFVPDIVDVKKMDECLLIKDEDAIEMAKKLAKERALFVGVSSGANVLAAIEVAKRLGKGKTVVTVLPDSADRYYSTDLFKEKTGS